MNMSMKITVAMTLAILATSSHAQKLCVFDPLGSQGDNYSLIKDYALEAKKWGADMSLKPYNDERLAALDFKSGKCDAVSMTGIRARQFNSFVGSIDSAGGILNNEATKMVISLMANPKLAADMVDHDTEVAGISTLGSAYLLVNDRNINSLARLHGKRFGALDYDKAIEFVVDRVGGEPISVELKEIGPMFNAGQLDIIFLPLIAFRPLELQKGIGSKGAIVRFPIATTTYDILIHPDKFPEGYGQQSRTWLAQQLDRQISIVNKIEKGIDSSLWMDLPVSATPGYLKIMREARISLVKAGIYNKKMMKILKKIRCRQDPKNFECSLNDE